MYYIQVAENEGDEPVELPLEADYTLAMSTLTAQYPGASGLKFRFEGGKLKYDYWLTAGGSFLPFFLIFALFKVGDWRLERAEGYRW